MLFFGCRRKLTRSGSLPPPPPWAVTSVFPAEPTPGLDFRRPLRVHGMEAGPPQVPAAESPGSFSLGAHKCEYILFHVAESAQRDQCTCSSLRASRRSNGRDEIDSHLFKTFSARSLKRVQRRTRWAYLANPFQCHRSDDCPRLVTDSHQDDYINLLGVRESHWLNSSR